MPVRSGPIFAPSPRVRVALGALLLEDHLAGRRRRRSRSVSGSSSSITFWRSGLGRPPPAASSFFARSAIGLSGWLASACFWSSDRSASCDLPCLDRVEQRRGPIAPAEQRRAARRGRTAGVSLAEPLGERLADFGRFAAAERVDQAARQLGRSARRDQRRAAARPRRHRPCGSSTSCRRGGEAGVVGCSFRRWRSSGSRRRSRPTCLLELLAPPADGERNELRLARPAAASANSSRSACSSSGVELRLACRAASRGPGRR